MGVGRKALSTGEDHALIPASLPAVPQLCTLHLQLLVTKPSVKQIGSNSRSHCTQGLGHPELGERKESCSVCEQGARRPSTLLPHGRRCPHLIHATPYRSSPEPATQRGCSTLTQVFWGHQAQLSRLDSLGMAEGPLSGS